MSSPFDSFDQSPQDARYQSPLGFPGFEEGVGYYTGGVLIGARSDELDTLDWTNTWTARTDMPSPARGQHGSFSIDGTVYACGGTNASSTVIDDTDSYVVDTWTARGDMYDSIFSHAAAATGGVGYAAGGHDGLSRLDTAGTYKPASHTWAAIGDMPSPARLSCSDAREPAMIKRAIGIGRLSNMIQRLHAHMRGLR